MKHPQNFRAWLAFVHDLVVAALAWASMYYLRYGLEFREPFIADIGRTLVWILPLQALASESGNAVFFGSACSTSVSVYSMPLIEGPAGGAARRRRRQSGDQFWQSAGSRLGARGLRL